jgi:hypothetical protein
MTGGELSAGDAFTVAQLYQEWVAGAAAPHPRSAARNNLFKDFLRAVSVIRSPLAYRFEFISFL